MGNFTLGTDERGNSIWQRPSPPCAAAKAHVRSQPQMQILNVSDVRVANCAPFRTEQTEITEEQPDTTSTVMLGSGGSSSSCSRSFTSLIAIVSLGGFPVPSNTTADVNVFVDAIASSVTEMTLVGLPGIRNSSDDVRSSDILEYWDGHHELATIADRYAATGQYSSVNDSSRVVEFLNNQSALAREIGFDGYPAAGFAAFRLSPKDPGVCLENSCWECYIKRYEVGIGPRFQMKLNGEPANGKGQGK